MLIYAQPADLTAPHADGSPPWLPTVPANAGQLIRRASQMITKATRLDRYYTYPIPVGGTIPTSAPAGTDTGKPSDPLVSQAFNDACCEQVVFWTTAGIDPVAGVAGQPLIVTAQAAPAGGSVTYQTSRSAEWLEAAVNELCEAAVDTLRNAGLRTLVPEVY